MFHGTTVAAIVTREFGSAHLAHGLLHLPPWALKAIDKCRCGFLWKGQKEVRGEHCLIAWPKVARPIELGGLGISSLQHLSWALNLRWLWLQKTEPDKVWNFFPVHAPKQVRAFFSVAVISEIGNGKNTCFWSDRWLHGRRLDQMLPHFLLL